MTNLERLQEELEEVEAEIETVEDDLGVLNARREDLLEEIALEQKYLERGL
jgi:hypothetical protein